MAALLSLFRHATGSVPPVTDGELLARFADRRDEDAFTELVRRHGPVVYRVCCRLVGADAAEDAFQAVFLVLATRWPAARAAGSVGGWLVGVAGRVARQMRRSARRRTRHETAAVESRATGCVEPLEGFTDQFRVLDEELTRLPDSLRDPVVLCFLQGRTQEQAAVALGRDARTLRRRLERAKQVLRARLERRGVVPAVAAALVAGIGSVSAAVPQELARRTVATVFDFLTGGTAVAGSAPVVLAKGVATIMIARKLMCAMAVAAVGLVGLGVGLAGDGPLTPQPTPGYATPVALPAQPTEVPVPPALTMAAPAGPVELDWKKDEATMAAAMVPRPASGERVVFIQALCVNVPKGFCERSGLTTEESGFAWALTPRERRMFTALLRAEPETNVLTRPQMCVLDGQTGFMQVGQQYPFVAGTVVEKKNGKTVRTSKVEYESLGVTLRVTPKIAANGEIVLRAESQITELGGTVELSPLAAGSKATDKPRELAPAFNTQTLQTTVAVPDTGTAVLRSTKPGAETLWVLTAHIVRNDKNAAPKPVPAAPVAPAPMPVSAAPPFVDHGAVEPNAEIKTDRVPVGSGVRIAAPALGPVPLALDVSVPVPKNPQDRK